MKKVLSLILVIVMLFSALPMTALTASASAVGGTIGDCTWSFNEDTGTLTVSGSGSTGDIIEAYPPWYEAYASDITAIVIDDSVTEIGRSVFYGLSGVRSIAIGSGVKKIGEGAFIDCWIDEVYIPETVETIGKFAFGYYSEDLYNIDGDVIGKTLSRTELFIKGKKGSAAEKYAEDNTFSFVEAGSSAEAISSIYAVGNGEGSWMNGKYWIESAPENKMTEVDDGVYEITFEDVPENYEYQFKFAANGSWDINWGAKDYETITFGTSFDAQYKGNNICFDLDEESDITLRLDLRNYDSETKAGAEYIIIVVPVDYNPGVINDLEVTITEPEPGEAPDFNAVVPEGKGYAVDKDGGVMWFNVSDDDEYIDPNSGYVFQPYKEYKVWITLVPTDESYTFAAADRRATLNDMEVGFLDYGWNEDKMVYIESYFVCAPEGGAAIREIEVYMDEPEVGDYPYYYAFVDSDRYSISDADDDDENFISNGIGWYNVNGGRMMSYTETFEEGKIYRWSIELKSTEFPFAQKKEISATVNGKKASVMRETDRSVLLWYDIKMPGGPTVIDTVEVTIAEPVAGEKPSYNATVPEGAGYRVKDSNNDYYKIKNGIKWRRDSDSYDLVPDSDVFEAGESYLCYIEIEPVSDAYVFPDDKWTTGVIFNGAEGEVGSINNYYNYLEVRNTFTLPDSGYDLWLGDTQVTEDNKDDILGDGGKAKFNPETNTLTLNNPTVSGVYKDSSDYTYKIYTEELDLKIKGKYKMTSADADYAFCSDNGSLTLEGDFTLMASEDGIYTVNGLNINSGSLAVNAGDDGITCFGDVKFGSEVTNVAVESENVGIYCGGNLTSYAGTVTVVSGKSSGIYVNNDINIYSGALSVTSGEEHDGVYSSEGNILIGYDVTSAKIKGGDDGVEANEGTVIISSHKANVTIESGDDGIYAYKGITLSEAVYSIICGYTGLYSCGNILLNTSAESVDIRCDGDGICADGIITVKCGSLSIKAGDEGIYCEGDLDINSDCSVCTIESESPDYGVYAIGKIDISCDNFAVKAENHGMYSNKKIEFLSDITRAEITAGDGKSAVVSKGELLVNQPPTITTPKGGNVGALPDYAGYNTILDGSKAASHVLIEVPSSDVYVLAGSNDWLTVGWGPQIDKYVMTEGAGGIYSITVPNVPATPNGKNYAVKVVQYKNGNASDDKWHGMDGTNLNYEFRTTAKGNVTVTFDPSNGMITVTGPTVTDPVYPLNYITAIGNGNGSWLNGQSWNQYSSENKMTKVSDGVYEITYKNVPVGTDYMVKFAANGSWDINWGAANEDTITLGAPQQAVYDGNNIYFDLDEASDVTLRLDLTKMNWIKKTGAVFTVSAVPAASGLILGDVDGDGEVSILDATAIQRYLAKLPNDKFFEAAANVDGDEEVSILDATDIQRWLAKLSDNKNIGKPV